MSTCENTASNPGAAGQPRREIMLPEEDREHLDALGLRWETFTEGGSMWLLIERHPIPAGYNVSNAHLALRIPSGYPKVEIDMAYFSPHLSLGSGRQIPALTGRVSVDGQEFQQWSRHRTPANPWRNEVDNVGTHLLQVQDWLGRELAK